MVLTPENPHYRQMLEETAADPAFRALKGNILITGAGGLLGSYLADALTLSAQENRQSVRVIASGRREAALQQRFSYWKNAAFFKTMAYDVEQPLDSHIEADIIVHTAGNTHPAVFVSDPVGTMMSAFTGCHNVLEYARQRKGCKVVYLSSGEVYGKMPPDMEAFTEDYCGQLDLSNPRSAYPGAKRAAETLCAAYWQQHGVFSTILRPCHLYGPTMAQNDSHAVAEFLRKAAAGEDIVLQSDGSVVRSYCFVGDVATAIAYALQKGEPAKPLNVADEDSVLSLRQLAECIAAAAGTQVCFAHKEDENKRVETVPVRQILLSKKLEGLGWECTRALSSRVNDIQNTLKWERDFIAH